jgi:hypothetical protein
MRKTGAQLRGHMVPCQLRMATDNQFHLLHHLLQLHNAMALGTNRITMGAMTVLRAVLLLPRAAIILWPALTSNQISLSATPRKRALIYLLSREATVLSLERGATRMLIMAMRSHVNRTIIQSASGDRKSNLPTGECPTSLVTRFMAITNPDMLQSSIIVAPSTCATYPPTSMRYFHLRVTFFSLHSNSDFSVVVSLCIIRLLGGSCVPAL